MHFHIGASVTGMTFYGQYPWESHADNTKLAIGGTLLFIGNARVVTNLILSGMFDRHPDAQDGLGRERRRMDPLHPRGTRLRDVGERAPGAGRRWRKLPSEYFRTNLYATFWFENNRNKLPDLIEAVGEDNILFETDFPHPTCLYPNPLADAWRRRWRR